MPRRMLAVVLLLVVAPSFSGATSIQSLVPNQHPAGCHEHSHRAPRHAPVNPLRCEAGAHAAIPQGRVAVGYSLATLPVAPGSRQPAREPNPLGRLSPAASPPG